MYIEHQQNVIKNRTKFDLDKALKEAHINEGYKIAIDNIDEANLDNPFLSRHTHGKRETEGTLCTFGRAGSRQSFR